MSIFDRVEVHEDVNLKIYTAIVDRRRELVVDVNRSGYDEVYTLWLSDLGEVHYYSRNNFYLNEAIDYATLTEAYGVGEYEAALLYEYCVYTSDTYDVNYYAYLGDPISSDPYYNWYELLDKGMQEYHLGLLREIEGVIANIKMNITSSEALEGVSSVREHSLGDLELFTRLYIDHEDCLYTLNEYEGNYTRVFDELVAAEVKFYEGMLNLNEMAEIIYELNNSLGLCHFSIPYVVGRVFQGLCTGGYRYSEDIDDVLDIYDNMVEYWYDLKDKYWDELGEGYKPRYLYSYFAGARPKDIRDMVLYENEGHEVYFYDV